MDLRKTAVWGRDCVKRVLGRRDINVKEARPRAYGIRASGE